MNKKNAFTMLVLLSLLLTQLALAPAQTTLATICDAAQFVADVNVQDGTPKNVGDSFEKTWRLKNVGSCTWSTSYTLVYDSGNQMGTTASVPFPKNVAPGDTVDLSVTLTAPNVSGPVRGYWKLKNASAVTFGIGSAADKAFWVEISVSTSGSGGVGYDFVKNATSATWISGAGALTFPGSAGDAKGAALQVDNPKLENGSLAGAAGLLVMPQNVINGFVQAQYPVYHVQNGDHFQSIVNCDYNATLCYVNFRLDYQIGSGPVITLWTFNEKYEGSYYPADRDLSTLAGQDVKFILRVGAAGYPDGDRAVWVAPRITNAGSGTPPTPTITPTPGGPTKTPVPSGGCVDRVTFVSDLDVPDGKVFAPNEAFTKTWLLKNTGTCTWTTSYKLVLVSGDPIGAVSNEINLTSTIDPNTTVRIPVTLKAPSTNGPYRGYWQFKNKDGVLFGIGAAADKPFWVDITVAGGSTNTAIPTVTGTPPTPTITPVGPTKTATPNTGPDRAKFLGDVTVPDGSIYASSTQFRKTWRIQNIGTSTWGAGYKVVFVSGDKMSGPDDAPLPASVGPNGTIDISVDLISPANIGHYKGYWMLKNASGGFFGIGAAANIPFWVDIAVTSTGAGTVTPTAPSPTVTATPPPSGSYAVVGVTKDIGTLNVHAAAGDNKQTASLPYNATNISKIGLPVMVGSAEWWQVQKASTTGWVNAFYLTEYVPTDTFCNDGKVTALLTNLATALKSGDGAALAALVSPKHGVDIRLVKGNIAVNYTQETAKSIFLGTTSEEWGPAASSGKDMKGSFKEIIQPKLLDVYNSPTFQVSCNDTSKVGPILDPWPSEYTNINFYSVYKSPTSAEKFDWRDFLVGIEYINGQPYLFSLIHFEYGT